MVPEWLGRLFATFNAVFSQLLGFLIPLIILGFVASAIADIGRSAGKMLVATAAIAYVATVCSGLLSFAVGDTVFPHLIIPKALSSGIPGGSDLTPFFTIEIPPLMTVMTALVLAFLLGICMASLKGDTLRQGFSEFREVVDMSIRNAIILSCRSIYSASSST